MDDTLTTMNGPLHDENTVRTDVGDRSIVAFYASEQDAAAARDSLVAAGIASDRIVVHADAASEPTVAAHLQPADPSIFGKIREAIAPDEPSRVPREAVREGQVALAVTPSQNDAERIVEVLSATHPRHFDARLERWRNSV